MQINGHGMAAKVTQKLCAARLAACQDKRDTVELLQSGHQMSKKGTEKSHGGPAGRQLARKVEMRRPCSRSSSALISGYMIGSPTSDSAQCRTCGQDTKQARLQKLNFIECFLLF